MSEETKDPAKVAEPGAAEPEAAEPGAAEPETAEPETAEPGAAEPEAAAAGPAEPPAATTAPDVKTADASTRAPQPEDDDDAVLNAEGRERPRFLLAFPQHPELARLSAAFEAGNYALVREQAEALAERAESPAVRDAALELRRRIDPDPLAKYLLALTAALLLFLAYFAYHH